MVVVCAGGAVFLHAAAGAGHCAGQLGGGAGRAGGLPRSALGLGLLLHLEEEAHHSAQQAVGLASDLREVPQCPEKASTL